MVVSLALVGGTASAQSATTGAIAGVVKDGTGAVLPGVTVEAASPVLIEKVRSAVTDAQGQYKVVELRPGTYTVTFQLTGFGTVKRAGLELTTGFTVTANADMALGSLEETVTVTGASPVVDIQNVRSQSVLTRQVLDSIPTGKSIQGFAALTLGAVLANSVQDVGGNKGEYFSAFAVHGNRSFDAKYLWDGMAFNGLEGENGAFGRHTQVNQVAVQEMALQTGGMGADSETGGVQMNIVPKDGGNVFQYYVNMTGTNSKFQGTNLSDELRARGLRFASESKKIYDAGFGIGGPVFKDKLWFYNPNRWWGAQETVPGDYYNKNQGVYVGRPDSGVSIYAADLSRPASTNIYNRDNGLRLTWQASAKNKMTFSFNHQANCFCFYDVTSNVDPAATADLRYIPQAFGQVTFTRPHTNRLLIEGGALYSSDHMNNVPPPSAGVSPIDIAIQELSTGFRYNAKATSLNGVADYGGCGTQYIEVKKCGNRSDQSNQRFTVSYVTGSHAFKTGLQVMEGWRNIYAEVTPRALAYSLRLGVPTSITEFASPITFRSRLMPNLGVYAQDQWTVKNLTLNLGVRFDYLRAYNLPQHLPAGPLVPARDFPGVQNVPNFKDLTPRMGAAYNLFGKGKTAIKGSAGRYVRLLGLTSIAGVNHPANTTVSATTRTWADANGDYSPDCDLRSTVANGECGALANNKFGTPIITTKWAPDVLTGLGNREYNWQASASVQHELRPGMALNVAYFRTWYGNFRVTANQAVASTDFDSYCITAPVDARLGQSSGKQLCGLYDLKPAKFGLVDNLVTQAARYGKQSEVYNGLDFAVNSRFGRGGLLQGGVSIGQTVTNNCFVVDTPQQQRPDFCRATLPYSGQSQLKLAGNYPLFWGLQASATLQNLPGLPLAATYTATNAQIVSTLGRNLGQCGAAATCNGVVSAAIMIPNTEYENRLTQFDVRLTKNIKVGRGRLQGMFDVYNLFNANTVLKENAAFGATWLQPSAILGARMFKFGVQLDY